MMFEVVLGFKWKVNLVDLFDVQLAFGGIVKIN